MMIGDIPLALVVLVYGVIIGLATSPVLLTGVISAWVMRHTRVWFGAFVGFGLGLLSLVLAFGVAGLLSGGSWWDAFVGAVLAVVVCMVSAWGVCYCRNRTLARRRSRDAD